jgi:hypothetical protein
VIPDEEATPRRETDDIPTGMEFPGDAVDGELYNIYNHTIAYMPAQSRGIPMGGRVISGDGSDVGGSQLPTPASAITSGKRKSQGPSRDAPLQKRSAHLALSGPGSPGTDSNPEYLAYVPYVPHDRLGVLEVTMVEIQIPIPNESVTTIGIQHSHAHGLFQTFCSADKMLLALGILATCSTGRDISALTSDAPAIPQFLLATTSAARMIAASRLARRHLEHSELNLALLRLQTLMSYLTLYLTLEYTIVPQIKREHPNLTPKSIAGKKYGAFYRLLADDPGGEIDETAYSQKSKFVVDIGFGKTYWTLLQDLGIAALLMIAVSDVGLTVLARNIGPGGQNHANLRTALVRSRAWWSFAHAIGPATLRTFFGPRDVEYTVPQLLQQLREEPLPTAVILRMNQSCMKQDIRIPTEHASRGLPVTWALEIGGTTIPVQCLPRAAPILPTELTRTRNVWHWLQRDEGSQPMLEFLLTDPNHANPDQVINFFCDFYNRRAIPGRMAVSSTALRKLSEPGAPGDTQQRLDLLDDQSHCELLVFAAPINDMILGIILCTQTCTATIYNWTTQEHLTEKANEVCS